MILVILVSYVALAMKCLHDAVKCMHEAPVLTLCSGYACGRRAGDKGLGQQRVRPVDARQVHITLESLL